MSQDAIAPERDTLPADFVGRQPAPTEYTEETIKYGKLIRARPAMENSKSKVAIIFLHGILGRPTRWENLCRFAFKDKGVNADFLFFRYPSFPGQSSTLNEAAASLTEAIDSFFPSPTSNEAVAEARDNSLSDGQYRHLYFVTHSLGGLVLKTALCPPTPDKAGSSANLEINPICLRTRSILNLAVPHTGGAVWFFPFALLYSVLNLALWPALLLIWVLSLGYLRTGMTWIYAELYMRGRLEKLNKRFSELKAFAHRHGLPFPIIREIRADSEAAAGAVDRAQVTGGPWRNSLHQRVRDFHMGIGVPKSREDSIVRSFADWHSSLAQEKEFAICDGTLMHNLSDRRRQGQAELLGGNLPAADSGQQTQVFSRILEIIRNPTRRSNRILLLGSMGLGKSWVLERIAQSLAADFLSSREDRNPVPIFVLLQDLTIERRNGESIFESILRTWCDWSETALHVRSGLSFQWLNELRGRRSVVYILDGVDEFLTNHPNITPDEFRNGVVDATRDLKSKAMGQAIILGIRSGMADLPNYEDGNWQPVRLEPIERKTAIRMYKGVDALLDYFADDPDIASFFLSPIVFFVLAKVANKLHLDIRRNEASVLQKALDITLTNASLGDYSPVDARHLLGLVAWSFAVSGVATMSLDEISTSLNRMASGKLIEQAPKAYKRVLEQERLHERMRPVMDVLMEYSKASQLKFSHVAWKDVLVAEVVSKAVEAGAVSWLGLISVSPREHRLAGELYGAYPSSPDLVRNAGVLSRETGSMLALGNVLAAYAMNPDMKIDKATARAFLAEVNNPCTSPLSRVLIINALCVRNDGSSKDRLIPHRPDTLELRTYIEQEVAALIEGRDGYEVDRCTISLAWAHAQQLGQEIAMRNCPVVLGSGDIELASSMWNGVIDGDISRSPRVAVLQASIAKLVLRYAEGIEARAGASIYYLFFLYGAWSKGFASTYVMDVMESIFDKAGEFSRALGEGSIPDHTVQLYWWMQKSYLAQRGDQ